MVRASLLLLALTTAAAPSRATWVIRLPTHEVTVVATDFKLALPNSLTAGPTTFRLVNRGRELHQLYLVRLADGRTAADLVNAIKAGGPPPPWATDVGGPNAVDPGATSAAASTPTRSTSP